MSTATRNACKLCAPFGASLAFKGVRGAIPFLHGSQGCATYIRRYMISHFKEPIDIASSNFSEETAIFGGEENITLGLENVMRQYNPELIGVATTCLSETIGDDVPMMLRAFRKTHKDAPPLVHVSTPSYSGTHAEGFRKTLHCLVSSLAVGGEQGTHINLLSGMLSPADLRLLKEMVNAFDREAILLPDYSDTLDGRIWESYQLIPEGGTCVEDIARMGTAAATLELGTIHGAGVEAGGSLESRFGVPHHSIGLPIGVQQTDLFFETLEQITGQAMPPEYAAERGRLVDAYVDAHKYNFDKRAVVFGEEEMVVGLVSFLAEIGLRPVLVVSGGSSGKLAAHIKAAAPAMEDVEVLENSDFEDMAEAIKAAEPDILIGSSKGYTLSRKLDRPLVRVGFPVHDRVGGARLLHVGYAGAQQLFDRITNALIAARQKKDPWGYTYM